MMFITCKLFTKFSYLCLANALNVVQPRMFYSSYNGGMSPSILPVISYLNADSEKDAAIKQNKSKSGIYRWTNVVNNKIYIGSSIDLSRRFKEYYNYNHISGSKRNFPIHIALLKYKLENFILDILECCLTKDVNNNIWIK